MAKYNPKSKDELVELISDESVNLGDIDTSAITDMSYLFNDSKRTDFSGIEKWDTSSVEDMSYMFSNAKHFNSDISGWNVSQVCDMCSMFAGAEKFNQDLSAWDTNSVHSIAGMFSGAIGLENIDFIDEWEFAKLEDAENMLYNTKFMYSMPKLYWYWQQKYGDESNFVKEDFNECDKPKYKPKTRNELQNLVANLSVRLDNIDTSAMTDMSFVFAGSKREDFSGIEKWDTSKITIMDGMFFGTASFNVNLNAWDTSSVTSMGGMFARANNFNANICKWDISKVNDMSYMFAGAREFNQCLEQWNPASLQECKGAFNGTWLENNPPKWYDASKFDDKNWDSLLPPQPNEVWWEGEYDKSE